MSLLDGSRFVEGRLSGLPYGSFPRTLKVPQPGDRSYLLRALRQKGQGSRDEIYNKAMAHLVFGNTVKAISILSSLETNSQLKSDLAAAYLHQHQHSGKTKDLIAASSLLMSLEKAHFNEAQFNKALVLERLHLTKSAELEWTLYLQNDTSSWAQEARLRLRYLESRRDSAKNLIFRGLEARDRLSFMRMLAHRQPNNARAIIEEDLMGKWAFAASHNNIQEAEQHLSLAESIGESLEKRTGAGATDILDAIRHIRRSRNYPAALMQGHLSFQKGVEEEKRDYFGEAYSSYQQAARLLAEAGSPYRRWAVLRQGICAYYQARYAESLSLLHSAIAGTSPHRYPALFGRSLWMQGVVYFVQGEQFEALKAHESAIIHFNRMNDSASVGFLNSLLAADLRDLGRRDSAWSARLKALSLLDQQTDIRRVYSILWEAAEGALAEGKPRLALLFIDELLLRVPRESVPGVVSESYGRRSIIKMKLGDQTGALADLRSGVKVADLIGDTELRKRVRADLFAAEARLYAQSRPRRALVCFGSALAYYERAGYLVDSATIRRERSTVLRRRGRLKEAEADLAYGVAEFQKKYIGLIDKRERLQYVAEVRGLIEAMVLLQVGPLNNPEKGLYYSDMLRVLDRKHLLLEEGRGGDAPDCATNQGGGQSGCGLLSELGARLPENVGIVIYMLAGDDLLIWTMNGRRIGFTSMQVARERITSLVERLSGADSLPSYSLLYKLLVLPISDRITGLDTLIVIPDENFSSLSFAALYDQRTSRFFVEDYAVTTAPSIRLVLKVWVEANEWKWPNEPNILILVNPDINRARFPELSSLPWADREGKEVAGLYRKSFLIRGRDATKEAFETLATESNIIHMAAHSSVETDATTQVIILASNLVSPMSEVMTYEDILGLDLSGVRIAIVASCGSGRDGAKWHQGGFSLGWAFLEAGALSVLVSLWDIDDQNSSEFLQFFHAHLIRLKNPLRALRAAQLTLLSEGERVGKDPQSWAAFQLIGF